MRNAADLLNLKPTDEKLNSSEPQFSGVSQDMNGLNSLEKQNEKHILGVFQEKNQLDDAVQELLNLGITGRRIYTFNSEQGNFLDHPEALIESKLGEGALVGILFGFCSGILCKSLGLYSFEAATNVPNLRFFFELMATCAIFVMIFGVLGAMIGRLIPQYKVETYETSLPDGYVLMVVKGVDGNLSSAARNIIKSAGGVNVENSKSLKNLDPGNIMGRGV